MIFTLSHNYYKTKKDKTKTAISNKNKIKSFWESRHNSNHGHQVSRMLPCMFSIVDQSILYRYDNMYDIW
jgi:hypothetical protein